LVSSSVGAFLRVSRALEGIVGIVEAVDGVEIRDQELTRLDKLIWG